ncbi:UNVERIFIED_CONTAM: LRR receptor-like serine/threonine-protein kinase GHR1 [Sesamum calycinum]|uniref:LRR receptor-like serine/threonine-protein kinase GHR1 n=1 Tax=Sesamum calycinum TaxID=2727403 RepID=A0AAW2Q7R0_9LAMI
MIDLSKNQFEGNLTRLLKWGNVEFLDLSQNHLTGSMPEVTAQFLRLNYLNISHNSLNGSLPKVLTLFPKLTTLDLSFNQLSGPLLTTLLTSSTLNELHLQNNILSGSIDFSPLSNNSNLRVLDLSNNQLNGYLPDSFGSLTGLQAINVGGKQFLWLPAYFPSHGPAGNPSKKHFRTIIKVVIIVSCVVAVIILILLAIFIHYKRISKKPLPHVTNKDVSRQASTNPSSFGGRDRAGGLVVSAEDLVTSKKGSSSEIISSEEKMAAITGFSPSKTSHFSWSPESGDSYTVESLSRLDVRSPDRLAGELYFLDDTISFSAEELSRAPAEVLGRSSHGTSYRATLDNGLFLTVKWLREGVAKQRKEFAKEAKKFANIRHPNVVGLRGYYWGPTQHEKLILSDYISPGSLASFLYDRPGRKGPPLTWAQRLKIAVDVARGLNYLHFDRAVPHGNLKATNILLDGPDFNGRVADYCLHRLMTQSGTIEQILDAGVLGYRAPELAASKKPLPSFKSDVYAFGVILLELLTGKCAGDVVSGADGGVDLTDWVRLRVAEGRGSDCFDAALTPEMSIPVADKGMKEVLGIALRCIRSVSERPGIKTIYEDLSSI